MESRTRLFSDGKLVVWSVKKCVICGRFIGKLKQKYCSTCAALKHEETKVTYRRSLKGKINHKDYERKHQTEYRHRKGIYKAYYHV